METFLTKEFGEDFAEKMWFPQGEPSQKDSSNKIFENAEKVGLDVSSLLVDLANKDAWSGNCLLPSIKSTSHYTFLHHRPLTGLEELL